MISLWMCVGWPIESWVTVYRETQWQRHEVVTRDEITTMLKTACIFMLQLLG